MWHLNPRGRIHGKVCSTRKVFGMWPDFFIHLSGLWKCVWLAFLSFGLKLAYVTASEIGIALVFEGRIYIQNCVNPVFESETTVFEFETKHLVCQNQSSCEKYNNR